MSHTKMYRSFIILQEDERGHSVASDKQVSGYAKIEVKNGKCKVSFYAQNIDESKGKCNIVLICGKKDMKKIINLGEMNINAQGKGEACKEYDETNIAELELGYEKITGAAIGILNGNKILSVLCGFMNGEQPKDNWKDYNILNKKVVKKEEKELKEEIKEELPIKVKEEIIDEEIKIDNDEIQKEYELEEKLKKDIEKKEKENQKLVTEEQKLEMDKKKRVIEAEKTTREIDNEKIREYEKVKAEIENKKRQVREEKERLNKMIEEMEKAENEIEDLNLDEIYLNKDRVEEDIDITDEERHHKKCKDKKKHTDNDEFKESHKKMCEEYEEAEIECECEIKDKKEKKEKKEKKDKKDKKANSSCYACREDELLEDEKLDDSEEIEENKFEKYESEIEARSIEEPFEIRGSVGEFFEILAEDLEEVRGKHKEIKFCKWYKVPVPTLDEMCNSNNYNKYTVIYYPMINYYPYIRKYGHFMLGYKCDSNGKMKYIVYGVAGKKDKSEQPYCGKTGFVSWIKDETMGEDMGYWLMFYDFKNSVVVVPME